MIYIKLTNGFGNNLFQYIAGRLLAEKHNNKIILIPPFKDYYGLENIKSRRGFHAHKKLEQAIFCINGSFKLMADDGENKQYLYLNNPNQGIFIGRRLWHTMFEFSKDCIILALASDHYDESDYIREYENFIKYIKRVK